MLWDRQLQAFGADMRKALVPTCCIAKLGCFTAELGSNMALAHLAVSAF